MRSCKGSEKLWRIFNVFAIDESEVANGSPLCCCNKLRNVQSRLKNQRSVRSIRPPFQNSSKIVEEAQKYVKA